MTDLGLDETATAAFGNRKLRDLWFLLGAG